MRNTNKHLFYNNEKEINHQLGNFLINLLEHETISLHKYSTLFIFYLSEVEQGNISDHKQVEIIHDKYLIHLSKFMEQIESLITIDTEFTIKHYESIFENLTSINLKFKQLIK